MAILGKMATGKPPRKSSEPGRSITHVRRMTVRQGDWSLLLPRNFRAIYDAEEPRLKARNDAVTRRQFEDKCLAINFHRAVDNTAPLERLSIIDSSGVAMGHVAVDFQEKIVRILPT